MNYPASVFRSLLSSWHRDAASERVDSLSAELAACVADARGSLCLGLVEKETLPRLYGLVYLLDSFGVVLRQRYREQGDAVYVFLDRKAEAVSEFAGTVVNERFAEVALPRAA